MQSHMRVDDLLTRSVNVQWFEGVALVQSACREVITTRGAAVGFPSPSHILLSPDGAVSITGPTDKSGAAGAAHLLAQMVRDDVPVRLRLLLTQATGGEGASTTIPEFSEALAYFERPDSAQILRSLYERAMLAAPRAELPVSANPVEPVAPAQSSEPAEPELARRRGVSGAAVLVAAVAAVLCGAVWLVGSGYDDARVYAALDHLKDRLAGQPETPPADAPVEAATGSAKRTTGKAAAAASNGTPRSSEELQRSAAGKSHPSLTTLLSLSLPELSPISRADRETAAAIARARAGDSPTPVFVEIEPLVVIATSGRYRGTEQDGRVYSRGDARVTPPRSVYPKLPPDSSDPAELATRTVLELLITTDGLVERVRLRTPPLNIHEFMLVSAAKAWRFEPATVEGHPVRFLHRVAITLQ